MEHISHCKGDIGYIYNKNSVVFKGIKFCQYHFHTCQKGFGKIKFWQHHFKTCKTKGFASNGAQNLTLDLDLFWQSPDKFSSNDW